jgi:hypothetical protein
MSDCIDTQSSFVKRGSLMREQAYKREIFCPASLDTDEQVGLSCKQELYGCFFTSADRNSTVSSNPARHLGPCHKMTRRNLPMPKPPPNGATTAEALKFAIPSW